MFLLSHELADDRVGTGDGVIMWCVLDWPLAFAAEELLEVQVPVNPGEELLKPIGPLPPQVAGVLGVPQAQLAGEVPELLP